LLVSIQAFNGGLSPAVLSIRTQNVISFWQNFGKVTAQMRQATNSLMLHRNSKAGVHDTAPMHESCVVGNIKHLSVQARGSSVAFHGRFAQISTAAIMTKHGE